MTNYRIVINRDTFIEAAAWSDNNIGKLSTKWRTHYNNEQYSFEFFDEEDATYFALMWGGR